MPVDERGAFPERIYIDDRDMFDGIHAVYPNSEIIIRPGIHVDNLGCPDPYLICPSCGQNKVFSFSKFQERSIITFDDNDRIVLTDESDFKAGKAMSLFDDDEKETPGLFTLISGYSGDVDASCMNCGDNMIPATDFGNKYTHGECPGCPLCYNFPTESGVRFFCVVENIKGHCRADCDKCKGCNAWYGRVKFNITPNQINMAISAITRNDNSVPGIDGEEMVSLGNTKED